MILTTQMIRDKLAFKGPMGLGCLAIELKAPVNTIRSLIDAGLESGQIRIANDKGLPLLFTTDWKDDVNDSRRSTENN